MGNCLVTQLKSTVSDPNKEMDYFGGVLVSITRQDPSTGISDAGTFNLYGATKLTFVDNDANFGENGEYGKTTTVVHNFKFKPVNMSDAWNTPYRVFIKNPVGLNVASNIYKMDIDKICEYTSLLYDIRTSDARLTPEQNGSIVTFHTTAEKCEHIRYITLKTGNPENDIDMNFAHFAGNTLLSDIRLGGFKYYGDIVNLASTALSRVDLIYYNGQERVTGTDGVYGELTSLAAAMASRESGTCSLYINGNCHTITLNGVEKTGNVTIRFGSSMVDPTTEETTNNYQIV